MKNFYMTFGVQYPKEPHPYWTGADGAGWVRIVTDSETTARLIAQQFFGDKWAFIYPENYFDHDGSRKFYPKGEILVLQQKKTTHLEDAVRNKFGFIVDLSPELGTFTDPSEEKVFTRE